MSKLSRLFAFKAFVLQFSEFLGYRVRECRWVCACVCERASEDAYVGACTREGETDRVWVGGR